MRLTKAVSILCSFSTLALFVAACGISSLGGSGDGGAGGSGNGGSGSGDGGSGNGNGGSGTIDAGVCSGPNPAGCKVTGCSMGQTCADEGCTPSQCDCDAATNTWICTDDCGGGTCVPDGQGCEGVPPAGCMMNGCPAGQTCVDQGCTSTYCWCEGNHWICSDDCHGGECVPEGAVCSTPNPVGCKSQGCPMGQVCVEQGCTPSVCSCDPATDSWICTDDCNGGECVPEGSVCAGPNPVGCKVQGCPMGQQCVDQGCTPSVCGCDPMTLQWYCTDDCGGGTCVPEP